MGPTLADLGERAAIQRLVDLLASSRNRLGFHDDAAALPLGDGLLVASTDQMTRATHVPADAEPEDVGWYAAAMSLSDVAAMGAEPLGVLAALGLPARTDVEELEGLARGLRACADAAGTEVLGGDTKEHADLTLTTTGLGTVPEDRLLPRAGGRPDDVLVVTGQLGGAAAGLHALEHGAHRDAAARLLRPPLRLDEARALSRAGATAAIDLSDGLAAGAHQLADASGAGLEVDADAVPVDPIAEAVDPARARGWALAGGGDFELLAAVPPDRVDDARDAVAHAGGRLTVLGHLRDDPRRELVEDGRRRPLPREGWEHFRR